MYVNPSDIEIFCCSIVRYLLERYLQEVYVYVCGSGCVYVWIVFIFMLMSGSYERCFLASC